MRIAIATIVFILKILPRKQRSKLFLISFLLLVNSVLELIGLGAILPVFAVLLEDNVIQKYSWAQWIYSTLSLTDERQLIIVLANGLLLVVVVKNILSLWIAKINSTFALTLSKDFSLRLHEIYYKKGFSYFKSTNSNVVVRNLRTATNQFSNAQVLGTLNLLNEVIVLMLIVIIIAIYNPQSLALLAITVVPPFYFFYRWVRSRSIELGRISNQITPRIGRNMFQSIYGYVDVIIAGAEKSFRNKIKKNLNALVDVDIKTTIYNLAPTKVIESSLMLAVSVIICFGIYFLPSKTELLKLLGIFAVAGYRIMPSINRIMIAINGLNRSKWTFSIMAPLKNLDDRRIVVKDIEFIHQLHLDNISFSYAENGQTIFKNFSLTIKKGEVFGITGPSGGGKTTLMNILLGFLEPSDGVYFVDDKPLGEQYLKSFYKKIGYVQQQVYLIDGTLAENIAFGCSVKEINQAKLKLVLERASLLEMVKNMPDGVNEKIGENGTRLSGGQRQRVGIARALYSDAEILFFDEATSSLDSQTEKEITESIRKLSDGSLTLIIIAHRMSTLAYCNRIITIDNKEVDSFQIS